MHGHGFGVRPCRALYVAAALIACPSLQAQDSETLSYYTIRFELATTSDWCTVTIDSGPKRNSRLVSQSEGLSAVFVGRGEASVNQPIEDALAGREVGVVYDAALAPSAFGRPFDLRIEKGHIGRARIRIYDLLASGPELFGEWVHDGIVPDADVLPNTVYLSLDLGAVLNRAPERLPGPATPKMAWAFYFPWYSEQDWSSRRNLKDVPARPYDSRDPAAIARHIDQAQGVGIDGFIVSWSGPNSFTDEALQAMLPIAAQKDFAIAVRLETLDELGQPGALDRLTERLEALLSDYGPDPALMKVDGKPVVFVGDSSLTDIETWSAVFDSLRAEGLDGFFLGESANQDELDVFDSLYTYRERDFASLAPFVFAVRPASRYRHLFADPPRLVLKTATVQPGYDDELSAAPGEVHIVDRGDGLSYRRTIDAMVYRDQEWILISTWNQFYENTHIEPSEAYGDRYLRLTAEMIADWLGPRPVIFSGGVVNSASYRTGAIAPGEIVTVFGEGVGPEQMCTMELIDGALVSDTLCDTQVTFNGNLAPLLYVRSDVVSAVAPLVLLQRNVRVQVSYRGVLSAQASVPVGLAAPGVYTLDSSGVGQAAALVSSDYSVNGPENPSPRGSTVIVYMTAGGPTDPPGGDGRIVSGIETLQLPVRAEIGGAPAQVSFAGSAPNLIKGAMQVNIRIPEEAPAGAAVPLVIWVANVRSQDGVTLAIR